MEEANFNYAKNRADELKATYDTMMEDKKVRDEE
jgi:hypothetical protein